MPLILDRLSIVKNHKINLEKLFLIDPDDNGHHVVEGELGLHIKYLNVYTLYDIESQFSSTHLVTTLS